VKSSDVKRIVWVLIGVILAWFLFEKTSNPLGAIFISIIAIPSINKLLNYAFGGSSRRIPDVLIIILAIMGLIILYL